MLNDSGKKNSNQLKLVITSLSPFRNLIRILGCITDEVDNIYSIGTLQGKISVGYTRKQFELAKANILSPSMISPQQITQTEVMQKTSLGIGPNACRCIKCNTTRCPCRKVSRHCTTKCHIGKSCLNKQ